MNWTTLINRDAADNPVPKGIRWLIRLILGFLRPVFKWYFPLKVNGLEHIPTDRNVLFAGNHQSYLDPVFISCAMESRHALNTCYLAKDKHFNSRFKRWFAASTRVMLISDRVRLRETIPLLGSILQSGAHLVIFPEGTRTSDGQVHEFKKTFALLADATATPIVPVLIDGAFSAIPSGQKKPLRHPVTVHFLNPIQPEPGKTRELAKQVEDAIRKAMSAN